MLFGCMYAGALVFCLGFFTVIFLVCLFLFVDFSFAILLIALGDIFLLTTFLFGCFLGFTLFTVAFLLTIS